MAYSLNRFVGPTALTTQPTNLYTFGSNSIVKQILITNVTNGNLNFSLYLIPSGQQVGSLSNLIYGNVVVPANTTSAFNLSLVCYVGDSLYSLANITNGLNVTISGVNS